jgi:Fe-S-cluster containining protein
MVDPALNPTPAGNTWLPLQQLQRRYPARADAQQHPRDERKVCERCLGGTCCTTEGPIALTPYDVLRLATALDLSPPELLKLFTQDRFDGPDGPRYEAWLRAPDNSVVSFLRRRTLDAASPCIFLKYLREADGTPRRVCSVHPARPLACREYYHDTCGTRWTGEMAVLEALGYEALRDGALTPDAVEARWRACGPRRGDESLAHDWQRAFWSEMRRAMQPERANAEGAFDRRLASLQDPIDQKINRLLSTLRLRFEEKYGPEPLAEQRHGFDAGTRLANGPERARLLAIVARPAGRAPLHGADGLRLHLGQRALLAPPLPDRHALLQLSARCGRRATVVPRSRMAELHLALASAFARLKPAGDHRLARAAQRHAAWALAFCRADLPDPDLALRAADGLAQLAHLGLADAVPPLRAWLRGSAGRNARAPFATWRRQLVRDPTLLQADLPLSLMAWCEPRPTLRALARLWASPAWQRACAEDRLALAERCLRLPGWHTVSPAAWRAAGDALQRHVDGTLWNVALDQVGALWHDDYVLRAITRAGLRGSLEKG